jgi:hypothetical protein
MKDRTDESGPPDTAKNIKTSSVWSDRSRLSRHCTEPSHSCTFAPPMNPSLSRPVALALATLLFAACGRREDASTPAKGSETLSQATGTQSPISPSVPEPQITVQIERAKADALGVTSGRVETALVQAFGASHVSAADNSNPSRIVFKISPGDSGSDVAEKEIFVRKASGDMVALSSLGSVTAIGGKLAPENPDAAFLRKMQEAEMPPTPPAVPAPPAAADEERAKYEAWFQKYNLDLNDPQMLSADADGDGVSNRDEFLAGTDPRDGASKPDVAVPAAHNPLRFTEYNEVRLPLVLDSVSGTQAVIRRGDGTENQTVRNGDIVKGFPLRVTKVASLQDRDKDGNPVDRSQVLLEDTSTKERVTLVKGLPAKTSATYAVITSDDGKTSVKVHAGEVFAWPSEPPVSYRVVDLGRDQITLQEQGSKKLWTIPRQ